MTGRTVPSKNVLVALLVAFIVLGGAGFTTFNAATEYTGSSEEVCLRDSDGVRTCSNPGQIGAQVLVLLGVESRDVFVTSDSLLNTSRALFAVLLLSFGAVALHTRATKSKNANAATGMSTGTRSSAGTGTSADAGTSTGSGTGTSTPPE
jgi:hypothetical protein